MSSVIDQITKPVINNFLCSKYNLTSEELLTCISDHFAKKNKCNAVALQYYYDNKDKPEYQDKLKQTRSNYYYNNKSKFKALSLAKYANDPVFREEYQRYQALYSQNRRGKNEAERRGRPRKYSAYPVGVIIN